MDETPSDSGESPASATVIDESVDSQVESNEPVATAAPPATSSRSIQLGEQIRRPAVWGLLVLIAIVLALQVWLLFL